MNKLNKLVVPLAFLLLISVCLWQFFLVESTSYYIVAVMIIVIALIPSFYKFENNKIGALEISLVAVITAIAVASRAVFYLIPQVKPIGAVVVVAGVCLGAERGFFIGAMAAFVSNIFFGQGIWTPFQMIALGFVGLIAGFVFKFIKTNRISLSLIGFLLCSVVYGLIVDLSSIFTMLSDYSFSSIIAIYSAGIIFNLVFGVSTGVFLFVFGEAFIKKIERIKRKYGLFQ